MMRHLIVPFELKSAKDRTIEGYGSTFGNVDLGGDVVLPGAFKGSLAEHKANGTRVKMLWNHRMSDLPIGVWTDLSEDKNGLYLRGEFADTSMGRDVHTLAKMGAIDSMSIGFELPDDGYDFAKSGERLIKEVKLWEVSPVNFPMNPKAVIEAVKSVFDGKRGLEKFLRETYSNTESKRIVSEVYASATGEEEQRDADEDKDALQRVHDELTATLIAARFK